MVAATIIIDSVAMARDRMISMRVYKTDLLDGIIEIDSKLM